MHFRFWIAIVASATIVDACGASSHLSASSSGSTLPPELVFQLNWPSDVK
jgi:hypothetical protein